MSDKPLDQDDESSAKDTRKLTMAERARLARKEQYKKAKEKQKAYLASPEVQKRLSEKKEALRKIRKEKSDQLRDSRRSANAAAKKSLSEDSKQSRERKQAERDAELKQLVRPALTLIQGGVDA